MCHAVKALSYAFLTLNMSVYFLVGIAIAHCLCLHLFYALVCVFNLLTIQNEVEK